jgi:peptide-methionine (S)-S-oxide reductase
MSKLTDLPAPAQSLPGRSEPISLDFQHAVLSADMRTVPEGAEVIWLGLGCFWGAERLFWQTNGVLSTAVGYAGGQTPNPTYEEVCTGLTGHTEIVQVVFDPERLSLSDLLKVFWQAHDPTQGMRQGNDIGTQYRSAVYGSAEQLDIAKASARHYQSALTERGFGAITTEIAVSPPFYYAEQYHQQYLYKNPNGYCGLKGTGVACPI